jgi:GNAT superfamily N-acetyltransferase
MLTLQVESLTEILHEIKSLLPLHWDELALNKDKVPLDPQFDIYLRRDAVGEVMLVTARRDGEVVGYFIGFVAPGLHYKTCLTLIMDIFFIRPDARNGFAGVKLFKAVEKEAIRRGVQRIFVGSKMHKDASALFERLEYQPIETFYSKWIGD